MYLPINGRIAIIDNEIKEVRPLFKTFSKNRIPYIFIDGSDMDCLPDESNELNDIRLLFLDLNLTDNRTSNSKEVKSSLYAVLKRVISPNNFPYTIILWSKQESDYKNVVEELFRNELKDRQPISIEAFIKSDYFDLDAEEEKKTDKDIINEIKILFQKHQAYSTLVYWENKVHKSADDVLQNIFTSYDDDTWVHKSNFLIHKLGQAYLGFTTHKGSRYIEQTKGALQAFNEIFNDTLEYNINVCSNLDNQPMLTFDESKFDKNFLLAKINEKLLLSKSNISFENIDYTGTVTIDENPKSDKIFQSLLNKCFNRKSLIKDDNWHKDAKYFESLASKKRKNIRENWQKVYVVLTPLCDKVQNKQTNIRIVKGFIIDDIHKQYIDNRSEAIFISPFFHDDEIGTSRILVLNFAYFFTFNGNVDKIKHLKPLFRLRSSIVSEIQSKLARNVSRQGVLYVE